MTLACSSQDLANRDSGTKACILTRASPCDLRPCDRSLLIVKANVPHPRSSYSWTIKHRNDGCLPVLNVGEICIELLVFLNQVRDILPVLVLVYPVDAHDRCIGPFRLK